MSLKEDENDIRVPNARCLKRPNSVLASDQPLAENCYTRGSGKILSKISI